MPQGTPRALARPRRSGRTASASLRTALLAPVVAAALVACGGGGGGGGFAFLPLPPPAPAPENPCPETGPYACKTGESEPLYTFQWALNYAKSWFTDHADGGAYGGGLDMNVEPVHAQGIKGQGVNVLVVDSGVDLGHEDLRENTDIGMSWNFETDSADPHPALTSNGLPSAHGTNVAGIIGAAQNGKGVMGIAPRVRLGGAAIVTDNVDIWTLANFSAIFGGAAWSRDVHLINGSYGGDGWAQKYNLVDHVQLPGIRGLKNLRDGKGIVFVKAAGNAFDVNCGLPSTRGAYDCTNPANDPATLEPNVIVTAALNAKGQASSYSSAGSVLWITGLGGESGSKGRYGEVSGRTEAEIAAGATGDGPTIFSTDTSGCAAGMSKQPKPLYGGDFMAGLSERVPGTPDNPDCDYSYMNGTSSAAPTITGVVALMLSANPDLSWRDVRDILRLSARQVDADYARRTRNDHKQPQALPYDALFDLKTNSFVSQRGGAQHIVPGATQVPVELGWVSNAAGLHYSNWYGFGVPDAAKAVELALLYKKEPQRSRPSTQVIPAFNRVFSGSIQEFPYQQVSLIGEFEGLDQVVDQFQVRLSAENICLGSLGIAVESPSGTKSLLKLPLDHFVNQGIEDFIQYGLGSYAFHGENAKGTWKIYTLASNPVLDTGEGKAACEAAVDPEAEPSQLQVEARVIAQ